VSITFPVELPVTATPEEVAQWLSVSGFTKVQAQRDVAVKPGTVPQTPAHLSRQGGCGQSQTPIQPRQRKVLDVVADRFRLASALSAPGCWRPSRWR
jgi:excinuclease ABC subunit A